MKTDAVRSVQCDPPCPPHLCLWWSHIGVCGAVKCPMETTCQNERRCLANGEPLEESRSE